MKSIKATILVLIFTAPTLFNIGLLADYGIRYQYYATVLCENKDMPEMHCNGHCQLSLQQDNSEDSAPQLPEVRPFEIQIVPSHFEDWQPILFTDDVVHQTSYVSMSSTRELTILPKPPEMSECLFS